MGEVLMLPKEEKVEMLLYIMIGSLIFFAVVLLILAITKTRLLGLELPPTDEVCHIVERLSPQVIEVIGGSGPFKTLAFRMQKVEGINFFIKISDPNGTIWHLRALKNNDCLYFYTAVDGPKGLDEPLEYFAPNTTPVY